MTAATSTSPRPDDGRRLLPRPSGVWRYATADLRALPDFIILGAARAGTTSLYSWLSAQPQVQPARRKEVHYFAVYYGRGARWYKGQFPIRRSGSITGEASPYLLYHPLAPERAHRDLPDSTRFIVLLREPVDRALSNYWHARLHTRWESGSFEEAIASERNHSAAEHDKVLRGEFSVGHRYNSYIARGRYAEQLQRWLAFFPIERFLILESELLQTDPTVSAALLEWLKIDPSETPYPLVNAAARLEAVDPELFRELHEYYVPYNEDLFALLGRRLWNQ
jgi:hypothetical protein